MHIYKDFERNEFTQTLYVLGDMHGDSRNQAKIFNSMHIKYYDLVISTGDNIGRGPYDVETLYNYALADSKMEHDFVCYSFVKS